MSQSGKLIVTEMQMYRLNADGTQTPCEGLPDLPPVDRTPLMHAIWALHTEINRCRTELAGGSSDEYFEVVLEQCKEGIKVLEEAQRKLLPDPDAPQKEFTD